MRCNFQIMENCIAKMKNKVAITGIQCKKKKKQTAGIKNNFANNVKITKLKNRGAINAKITKKSISNIKIEGAVHTERTFPLFYFSIVFQCKGSRRTSLTAALASRVFSSVLRMTRHSKNAVLKLK